MRQADLEKRLDYGEQWGFIKNTDSPDYLGWVLITKRKPKPVTPIDPEQDRERYLKWVQRTEALRKQPYSVLILELRRDVHESGQYESTEDYRTREYYLFASLEEVVEFLHKLGYSLENIKHRSELDAP
jgi:hypothetical protein